MLSFKTTALRFAGQLLLTSSATSLHASEIEHPFELPESSGATLDIKSRETRPFNHMLLGLNCSWPENLYGMTGYNNPEAQKLIRAFKPSSLRWPHGVWANFYDWETDGRRLTDNYKTPYDSAVTNFPDLKYGFEGLSNLRDELKFDVLFTWNINYDSPEKGAQRFIDRRDKGFQVKWIELGNETFWKTQRSEAVSDVHKYIAVTKAHTTALKEIDPSVRVSINATWRDVTTAGWNVELAKEDYYDAVTLHKYIEHPETAEGAKSTLRARHEMIDTAETMQKVFSGRPIWLSEWAINGGHNAFSVLGMADTYLGIISRPDLFEIASYFQLNAKQPMVIFDKNSLSHTKTSYGAAYEVIRDAFEGGEIVSSRIDSPLLEEEINAVNAEVVVKNGEFIVLAINKSNQSVPLRLKLNGTPYTRDSVHQALSFETPGDMKTYALDESPLTAIDSEGTAIILPPLSISRINGKE